MSAPNTNGPLTGRSLGPTLFLVAAALVLGLLGGVTLTPLLGDRQVAPVDLEPGDLTRRVDALGIDNTPLPAPAPVPAASATPNTPPIDPETERRLQLAREQAATEQARLGERARLAADSPLTPAVEEPAALVARSDPAPAPAAPERGSAAEATGTIPALTTPPGDSATGPDAAQATVPAQQPQSAPPTHLLTRGAVIPAVLMSPIDSGLPGLVRATVNRDVYDSLTGGHLLIPRGATLVGTYGSNAAAGQQRLFITWTDLRLADGTPLDVTGFGAIGDDAMSGVQGRRSSGFWTALGASVLFDLAGNATEIITGSDPQPDGDLAYLARAATGSATSRVTDQHLGDLLARGTRFRVNAGTLLNVAVERDMQLPAQPRRAR